MERLRHRRGPILRPSLQRYREEAVSSDVGTEGSHPSATKPTRSSEDSLERASRGGAGPRVRARRQVLPADRGLEPRRRLGGFGPMGGLLRSRSPAGWRSREARAREPDGGVAGPLFRRLDGGRADGCVELVELLEVGTAVCARSLTFRRYVRGVRDSARKRVARFASNTHSRPRPACAGVRARDRARDRARSAGRDFCGHGLEPAWAKEAVAVIGGGGRRLRGRDGVRRPHGLVQAGVPRRQRSPRRAARWR